MRELPNRFTFRMTENMDFNLAYYASKYNTTKSEIIREAIEDYILDQSRTNSNSPRRHKYKVNDIVKTESGKYLLISKIIVSVPEEVEYKARELFNTEKSSFDYYSESELFPCTSEEKEKFKDFKNLENN